MGIPTIVKLRFQLATNTIMQLSLFERFSLTAGSVLFLYAVLIQNGLAYYGTSHFLLKTPGLYQRTLLMLYAALSTLSIFIGLFLGKRYFGPIGDRELERFPFSHGQILVSRLAVEAVDPLLIACTVIAGIPLVALLGLAVAGVVQIAVLTALFMATVVVTRMLWKTAFGLKRRHSVMKTILGCSVGVPAIISTLMLIRAAQYGPKAGALSALLQEEEIGWLFYSPPGLLVLSAMAFRNGASIPLHLCILILVLLASLFWLNMTGRDSSRPVRKEYYSDRPIDMIGLQHLVSRVAGRPVSPLVCKDIVYYFRCDRTRLAFLAAPIAYWIIGIAARPGVQEGILTWQLFAVVVGVMTALVMSSNIFAYEASGIVRYITAPVPVEDLLKSKLQSSMFVAGSILLLLYAMALCVTSYGLLEVSLVFMYALPLVLMSVLIGQYVSIHFPMAVGFFTMVGQAVPLYSLAVSFACTACLMVPFALLEERLYPLHKGLFLLGSALFAVTMYSCRSLLTSIVRSAMEIHSEHLYRTLNHLS